MNHWQRLLHCDGITPRMRRYTFHSAAIHLVALCCLLSFGTCSRLKASRLPKGVVGGEGKTVALGKVPVRRPEPTEDEEEQERKTAYQPRMVTRRHFAPHVLAVPVPEEFPQDLHFDDEDRAFLTPSQVEAAGTSSGTEGESGAGVPDGSGIATGLYAYQVKYRGGDWNPDPAAFPVLMREVRKRTKIPTLSTVQVVHLGNLHKEMRRPPPFVYITGHGAIEMSERELGNLRAYVTRGGLLLIDDCGGLDAHARKLIQELFPKTQLRRIPMTHAIYHSYYPIRSIQGGNVRVTTYHEGVFMGPRLAVFYTRNDLGCAWEKRPDGKPVHPCQPGGEEQREWAYRMGVNLIVYALNKGRE